MTYNKHQCWRPIFAAVISALNTYVIHDKQHGETVRMLILYILYSGSTSHNEAQEDKPHVCYKAHNVLHAYIIHK